MKLEHIRTFCALIEGGSLEEAARRVHRTQPAVSQHLRALETEFGHTLYERRAGRATPAGDRLYRRAREILNRSDDLLREMREFDEGVEELIVGASDTNALYYLPPYLSAFRNAHAQTPLSIVCRPSGEIAEAVAAGAIDVGIVTPPIKAETLAQHRLDVHRLVLIAPRGHPLAGRKRVSPARLKHEPFVLLDSATRTGGAIDAFLESSGIAPNVVMRTGSFEVVKRYVAEGLGVSFVPRRAIDESRDAFNGIAVPGLPAIEIGAVWRSSGYQPVGVRRFLDILGGRPEDAAVETIS